MLLLLVTPPRFLKKHRKRYVPRKVFLRGQGLREQNPSRTVPLTGDSKPKVISEKAQKARADIARREAEKKNRKTFQSQETARYRAQRGKYLFLSYRIASAQEIDLRP